MYSVVATLTTMSYNYHTRGDPRINLLFGPWEPLKHDELCSKLS